MGALRMIVFTTLVALGPLKTLGKAWTGYKVIRTIPKSQTDVTVLQTLIAEEPGLDVWKEPLGPNKPVDIMLSSSAFEDIKSYLQEENLQVTVMMQDVQQVIDEQSAYRMAKLSLANGFDYSIYHPLPDIYNWMYNIANMHNDKATIFHIGKTYEGRDMIGMKISTQRHPEYLNRTGVYTHVSNKPAFWIQGGIHAREWISPATMIYMAGQMLDKYNIDMSVTRMVDSFDWYILPVANPDGYAHTWINDTTRMWRKTRSIQNTSSCIGVDPNRNWDIQWCQTGASTDPCSQIYCGPSAFSEVEVKGVADYLRTIPNLKGFIDFHSYSQMWLSPWGYTRKRPRDFQIQNKGSIIAVQALQKPFGTKYVFGTIARTIYIVSGGTTDWVYGKLGVKFSYGVELRDTGTYGFLLPADQIIPSGIETLEALIALADFVRNNLYT